MPRALGRALLALGVPLLLAAAPGLAAPSRAAAAVAPAPAPVSLTGTYELLAKDVLDAHGDLTHVYTDVLRVPGRDAIPLRLPAGHGLRGGTRIRVSAQPVYGAYGAARYDVRSVTRLAPASVVGTAGTTSVLVILAYWTAPDAVTLSRATAQVFGDDDRWFREVSYGKAGLAGVVTPWVRIAGPTDGRCFAGAETLMGQARAKAAALGGSYDPSLYDRTILYFPKCAGGDTAGVAGWAYEPGSYAWLNGVMDRRTTVHEQGHNYGLGHATSLSCTSSSGARVTFSGKCAKSEYGDPYDAMGRSAYAAHFSGYRKDVAGWLGSRKRVMSTSSSTFTLPPFEKPSTLPLVVVARSPVAPNRSYWLEYRRPVGMDAGLPSGATGGVLVHLVDSGRSGALLDGSPSDKSMTTAVLRSGTSWTAPDHVKIAVGAISSTGARVTVTGAKPAPAPPSTPRSVVVTPLDGRIQVSWAAPSSSGGAPVTAYEVVAATDHETVPRTVDGATRTTTVNALRNGTRYTLTVRARNAGGLSPAAVGYATPYPMNPSVTMSSPAAGQVVTGSLAIAAAALPHPVTQAPIACLHFYVDDVRRDYLCGPETATAWFWSPQLANGAHAVKVVATDTRGRSSTAGPVTVTFRNPVPQVAVTAPATGATLTGERVTLEAQAGVETDPSVPIARVEWYDVTDGYERWLGSSSTAPYAVTWGIANLSGARRVVARAITRDGYDARSAPVDVTITHPPSVVTITSPAAGSEVRGTSVKVTADTLVTAAGVTAAQVVFSDLGGEIGRDSVAPFEVSWDLRRLSGSNRVTAVLYESSGRTATDAVWVEVGNVLPVAVVQSPQGAVTRPGVVTVRGLASAGAGGGAEPDRVTLSANNAAAVTVPVVNGAWSYEWDSGTRFGYQSFLVRAHTPEGLVSAPASGYVYVERPRPVTAIESPAPGAYVGVGTTLEAVVSAASGAGDPYAVSVACLRNRTYGLQHCSYSRAADGKFHIVWHTYYTGPQEVGVDVGMSDGASFFATAWTTVVGALPPRPPGLTLTPGDGTLTATVTPPARDAEDLPITGYRVTLGGGQETIAGAAGGSVTFTGLVNGQPYAVSAVALNAVGASALADADGTPRAPAAGAGAAQAGLAPLWALPATALGRRRRAAARPWTARAARRRACPATARR